MKTVLHVIEQLSDFGGTPRKLLYLAAHHDTDASRLIFATYCDSSLKGLFEQHTVRVLNMNTLSIWRLAWQIARLARSEGADVICTHYTRPLLAGFLASRITGLPFIHNEHSSAHYRSGWGRRMAVLCLPFASAVVCNSMYTAKTIAAAYRVDQAKLRVLYNPVEARHARMSRAGIRREMGVASDALVIGHVGGMIASRDQATLIRAFHAIHYKRQNSCLWLIGDGPLRSSLEALAKELGIDAHVRFLGYTDRIGDYLAGMDVYVNPTIDEGFGIAVVEAMLAGLPVVLANAGAHPELITDGKDGFLYESGSFIALTSVLNELLDSPALSGRIGAQGKTRALTHFAPEYYARGYQRLIDEIAAERESRASRLQRHEE